MSLRLALVAAALPVLLAARPSLAQGTAVPRVSVTRQLEFGLLIPGVSETVTTDDAAHRAELVIHGIGPIEVQLLAPRALTSPQGGTIPLRVGPNDAEVELADGTRFRFDPSRPLRLTLLPERDVARIYVGGVALVPADQGAGSYTAVVSLLVYSTDR